MPTQKFSVAMQLYNLNRSSIFPTAAAGARAVQWLHSWSRSQQKKSDGSATLLDTREREPEREGKEKEEIGEYPELAIAMEAAVSLRTAGLPS